MMEWSRISGTILGNIMLIEDADRIQRRSKREQKFYDVGLRVGMKFSRIIMAIIWGSKVIRRCLSKRVRFGYRLLIWRFISGFCQGVQLRWICCDECFILGFDYKADLHGWKYYDRHSWLCANCQKEI